MRVNIVMADFDNENRILPRKAQALVNLTGWSLSKHPDMRADLNYYFPYLTYQRAPTLTAAYFTHREPPVRQPKADIWDDVAATVDVRITSSRHNLPYLIPFGPTFLAVPPLDRNKFRPNPEPVRHSRPVVGTSGYVYQGGRKGEEMIAAVCGSKVGRSVEWRASGRGWPIPTKGYFWEDMQQFYQGLDVYICSSLLEGVGYGPLEALACGVPVVIPRGVGVFDDLPITTGICRYAKGDAADMARALAEALDIVPDREALRATTEMFTDQRWFDDHAAAFATLEGNAATRVAETLPDWHKASGLYVVAFGEPARKCAKTCIETFKRHMPGIPVMLCAAQPLGPEDMLVVQPDSDIGARAAKIKAYELTPPEWQYVLYLDADTETIAPLDPFFQWLQDGYELVICKNPQRFAVAANMGRKDNTDECQKTFTLWGTDQMMQWAGGVFAFRRCEPIRRLFERWLIEWNVYGKRDQGALLRALWHEPVRAMWLGNEWNLVEVYDSREKCAGIIHHPMTARRWSGIVFGRSDSPEAWQTVKRWEQRNLAVKR